MRKTMLVRPEAEHLPLSNPSSQQGGEEISQENLTEKLQCKALKISKKRKCLAVPLFLATSAYLQGKDRSDDKVLPLVGSTKGAFEPMAITSLKVT